MEGICALARTAAQKHDPVKAAAVHNRSALLASDCGLPDLARAWCHRHAQLHLDKAPLNGQAARRALEPLVNLARLRIRAGEGESAYQLLAALYTAVTVRTDTTVDGIEVPASTLTATADDHQQLHRWLWSIILADAPRALITAGRWHDAHVHMQHHRGIGHRLLDGLQIAIIAAATDDDPAGALALLNTATPDEPWERAVGACLTVLAGRTTDQTVTAMLHHYQRLTARPELAVFHTRLGLSVLDATAVAHHDADAHAAGLVRQTLATRDGYAVRDLLAHPRCAALLTADDSSHAHGIVRQCHLGAKYLPPRLNDALTAAMDTTAPLLTNRRAAAC
ncbi:hypothetical protein [Actinomadura pelletieri]|uniref:hypothetical protein n=1 Tax=Actinomadura pelletieri TaxID=111805 RepID=UPI0011C3FFA8|nr:hypothetical protein [Actinomadura pelletieri]